MLLEQVLESEHHARTTQWRCPCPASARRLRGSHRRVDVAGVRQSQSGGLHSRRRIEDRRPARRVSKGLLAVDEVTEFCRRDRDYLFKLFH
jgi:hypothetical protein